ncbi:MAG TPA: C39 family peptidase [Thermomicrobiales bacterium]|nr:C39 family peptidase [Thermomicrobiales bacterium]
MRRILGRAVAGGTLALAMCLPLATSTPSVFAQSTSVEAWATIGATHPAPGCSVDVALQLQDGGSTISGADVAIVFSLDSTGEVISSDEGQTDGDGVANLTYDTSNASAGDKGWLEVHVNGQYLGGQTIWADGDSCDQGSTLVDMSGSVPTTATSTSDSSSSSSDDSSDSSASVDDSSDTVMIPNVSAYLQQRPLSCEFAALSIATGALGDWVSEYDFDDLVGWSDNPHWGFRGDINGEWGGTTDYGVYAEALVPALNQYGFQGDVFYGGVDTLKAEIAAGNPTLVWMGLLGDQRDYETTSDGTTYQLTAGEHAMVAYGYDDGGVYVSNPGSGTLQYYDWGTFEYMWGILDDMALSVHW